MNLRAHRTAIFCLAMIFSTSIFANDNVAKVIIMRGMVKAKLQDGSIIDVKVDLSIPEGAVVQTADKSFVKLLFIDKSQMNIGPNSQMVINTFPKKEAGIITLVKGQIRSQVTKDYMEMDDKNKSKLYIKTKTAAMGIRGTDFQVNYNPQNQNTALITFEGKVAMSHIDREFRDTQLDQSKLERVVSSDKAVAVTAGQISAVNLNVAERAMIPTKLGTKQIEALEKNETGINENQSNSSSTKQFRNPIPPGADGSSFSNIFGEAKIASASNKALEAEGFFNVTTGEYKLPAGSIIDLSTVNIIPPPNNAVFDSNTGTFIVPETLGRIDKATGEYKAPVGLELTPDGKFIVVDKEAYKKTQEIPKGESEKEATRESGRDPASESGQQASPAPTEIMPPEVLGGEAKTFLETHSAPAVTTTTPATTTVPATTDSKLTNLATEIKTRNDVLKETATNTGTISPNTKVKIIFNAE